MYFLANYTHLHALNHHFTNNIPKLAKGVTLEWFIVMISITQKQLGSIIEGIMCLLPNIQLLISYPNRCLSNLGGLPTCISLL